MEHFPGDTEESTEEIPGRKKSKLKSLRSRLFGRNKRTGGEEDAKLSQSASDITAGKGLGSDEDLACSQGMMGSRALSHDSIFLADGVLTADEPARVLSQENVHSKIKALQIKLQQQKMHLGPPPAVLPIRRPEDVGSRSEDDSLPHSPQEVSGGLSKTSSQPSSRPISPIPKPAPPKSVPSAVEPPLDFSTPAQFTPCLDTSAARHRMSVKPRNQRASTKKTHTAYNESNLNSLNNINNPESVREEEQQIITQEEATLETEQGGTVVPVTSPCLPLKSPEVTPIVSEATSKPSFSQQDQALLGKLPSVLRVKPHRPADATPSERPHSSFILSDNRDADVGGQGASEITRGIKRPTQGSGSFHLSIATARNRDGERPRSGSFVGVHKAVVGAEDKPFTVGRLRQEGALNKSSVPPWDRRDTLKKVESVTPSKHGSTDKLAVEVEGGQEAVEEATEAQEVEEDEGKTAFGVKLRSTSLSTRYRPDVAANQNSKPPEEQKRQEVKDLRPADPTPTGFSLPAKQNPSSAGTPHTNIMVTEVQTTAKEVETVVAAPQEPQPAPQTASPEVSWMSLAMEKTRSLQQLFTSRFPRDFTGVQTAASRPQTQTETPTGAQTQTVKKQQSTTQPEAANQPSTDAVKAESQAQTVKPSLVAVQQKTSLQSNTSREPQTLRQTSEPQSASHPAVQTSPWTTQSPLHSSTQTETSQGGVTQSLAQSYLSLGQQQPAWSNRNLHSVNQLKSITVSTTSSAPPPPVSALGRGEREAAVQEKEGSSQSGRRPGWSGSVSEKAAFLEKRAEWTTATGTKGVELKKAQTEAQTSVESAASVRSTTLNKDVKPEGRPGVKLAESSPTKVPERPREEKWLRKNVASSSPSSSPESGQPSWMELAKRKSMAWSDKSMD